MAEPTEVRVYRGQSVEIQLRAGGRVPGPLRYLIRSQPKQGTLGEPRAVDKNSAVITYTHDPKFRSGADSFRFAVQAVDSPVSAPAEVLIHVQDPPAKLETIPSLDFGEVPSGSHSRQVISVANSGGTSATVTPSVGLPWILEDTSPQTVQPGKAHKWTILFSPTSQGNYSGEFRIPGSPAVTAALSGRAVELFSISPDGPLILSTTESRRTSLTLKNRTDRPLTLQVSAPAGILVSSTVELPANAEASLQITADPASVTSVSGTLLLESEGFRKEISVRSEAVQAILVATPAKGFEITVGTSSERISKSLILENQGGSPARLGARSPIGVVLVPDPSSVIIAPGKSQTFEVSFEIAGIPMDASNTIEILSEQAPTLSIPLKFIKPESAASVSTYPSPPSPPVTSLPTFPELNETPKESTNDIPAISEIRLVSQQPGEVQMAWTHPSPLAKSFVLEFRSLEYVDDNSPPLSKWTKFPYARFQEIKGEVVATMTRLPPDSSWFIRAVSLDSQGKRSIPSESVRISSPPHPPRPWLIVILVGVVMVGVVVLVARNVLQARQTRESDEATRISRLEGE